jgi:hypothetical protein
MVWPCRTNEGGKITEKHIAYFATKKKTEEEEEKEKEKREILHLSEKIY